MLCSHPIDVVKTRLQVSGGANRNYKALGVSGMLPDNIFTCPIYMTSPYILLQAPSEWC